MINVATIDVNMQIMNTRASDILKITKSAFNIYAVQSRLSEAMWATLDNQKLG
jgi:hypothetical protein